MSVKEGLNPLLSFLLLSSALLGLFIFTILTFLSDRKWEKISTAADYGTSRTPIKVLFQSVFLWSWRNLKCHSRLSVSLPVLRRLEQASNLLTQKCQAILREMPLNPTRQPEPIGVKRVRSVWPEKRLWLRPHISLVSSYIVRDAAQTNPMLTRCVASARTMATPLTFHPTEWGEMCQEGGSGWGHTPH